MRTDDTDKQQTSPDCETGFARAIVTVVSTDGRIAVVESSGSAGCGGCQQSKGCGTRSMMALFGEKRALLSVENTVGAQPGDRVEVQLEQSKILRISALSYLLPLIGLVGGGAIGDALNLGDGVAFVAAIIGLGGGFAYSRYLYSRNRWDRELTPSCVRRIASRGEHFIDAEAIR